MRYQVLFISSAVEIEDKTSTVRVFIHGFGLCRHEIVFGLFPFGVVVQIRFGSISILVQFFGIPNSTQTDYGLQKELHMYFAD